MGGYVFNISKDFIDIIPELVEYGYYSTILKNPHIMNSSKEGTLTDFLSMNEGDSVFFFSNRKLYGYGVMKNIEKDGISDCKFNNYINVSKNPSITVPTNVLARTSTFSSANKWVCFFEPRNHFFKNGVDMDEALLSNPNAFKSLRVMQMVSFIKIDNEECSALKSILIKKNYPQLNNVYSFDKRIHENCKLKLTEQHKLSAMNQMKLSINKEKKLHEMIIEAVVIEELNNKNSYLSKILGEWDYLDHQVVASPFKPIHYMDKMDIYGQKYIEKNLYDLDIIIEYLVGELKSGIATNEDVDQIMKYVDWTSTNSCAGDFNMIQAFLLCNKISKEVADYAKLNCIRQYSIYSRDSKSTKVWNKIKLIEYSYNEQMNSFTFKEL